MPAPLANTVSGRASSILESGNRLIKGDWIASFTTAAWVYLGGTPQEVFEAVVSRYHRIQLEPQKYPVRLRQLESLNTDVSDPENNTFITTIQGLRCTTVHRTTEDLLRLDRVEKNIPTISRLMERCDVPLLRSQMAQRRHYPGMAGAMEALDKLSCARRTA